MVYIIMIIIIHIIIILLLYYYDATLILLYHIISLSDCDRRRTESFPFPNDIGKLFRKLNNYSSCYMLTTVNVYIYIYIWLCNNYYIVIQGINIVMLKSKRYYLSDREPPVLELILVVCVCINIVCCVIVYHNTYTTLYHNI